MRHKFLIALATSGFALVALPASSLAQGLDAVAYSPVTAASGNAAALGGNGGNGGYARGGEGGYAVGLGGDASANGGYAYGGYGGYGGNAYATSGNPDAVISQSSGFDPNVVAYSPVTARSGDAAARGGDGGYGGNAYGGDAGTAVGLGGDASANGGYAIGGSGGNGGDAGATSGNPTAVISQ